MVDLIFELEALPWIIPPPPHPPARLLVFVGIYDQQENEDTAKETEFLHPHDRNGKLLSKRFTTHRVRSKRTTII